MEFSMIFLIFFFNPSLINDMASKEMSEIRKQLMGGGATRGMRLLLQILLLQRSSISLDCLLSKSIRRRR